MWGSVDSVLMKVTTVEGGAAESQMFKSLNEVKFVSLVWVLLSISLGHGLYTLLANACATVLVIPSGGWCVACLCLGDSLCGGCVRNLLETRRFYE